MKLSETVRIFGKVLLCGLICSGSTRLTAQTLNVQEDTGDSKARLIGGNDQQVDVDGQDRTFAIQGQNNQVRIHGTCHGVTVLGNGNKVDLDQVESLALFGKDNHVTYLVAANGASPSIASAGTNNVAEVRAPDRPRSDSTAQTGGLDSDHLIVLNGSNGTFDQQVGGKNVVLNGSSGKAYLHGKAGNSSSTVPTT